VAVWTTILGVVELGLFVWLTRAAVIAGPDGTRILERSAGKELVMPMLVMPMSVARAGRAAVIALAVGMLAPPALAQQPSAPALALARELIELKGYSHRWDSIVSSAIEQMRMTFPRTDPSLAKDLNEVAAQLRTEYAPRSEELNREIAQLYARSFTEQELRELVAFYRTPVARKALEWEPRIYDETVILSRDWFSSFSKEVLTRMRAELKKRGHNNLP
jgi:hypothetical protein